jgi:hypothetical protein
MKREYTEQEIENDVPELQHIYEEHKREQLKDIILDGDEDEYDERGWEDDEDTWDNPDDYWG